MRTVAQGAPVPDWPAYVFACLLFIAILVAALCLTWPYSPMYLRLKQAAAPARVRRRPPATVDGRPIDGPVARIVAFAGASVARRAGLAAVMALSLFVVAGWLGGLVGLVLGWLLAVLHSTVRANRRTNQFADQLPDALQLVIGSLKAGFSLQHSLDALVRESAEPVAAEFGRAMSEHRLGADVSDALERVAQRMRSEDLSWTVMAVRIQREVGGNLADVLQTTVDTMRERTGLRRHVRSLSAEGRLSAAVLIALPIVLSLFMFLFRRDYLAPLFTDPAGLTMVLLGGLLFVVGIFWMARVIKVEA